MRAKAVTANMCSNPIIDMNIIDCVRNVLAFFSNNKVFVHVMTNIDEIDEKILRVLSVDGRVSNLDLADKIGLSASACSRRVQELERSGVIKGYRAILDREAMGRSFVAYVTVGLSRHLKEDQDAFEEVMQRTDAVTECHNVTGSFEYFLKVEVADLQSYKTFHTDVLATVPQVNSIISHIVMESPKE